MVTNKHMPGVNVKSIVEALRMVSQNWVEGFAKITKEDNLDVMLKDTKVDTKWKGRHSIIRQTECGKDVHSHNTNLYIE